MLGAIKKAFLDALKADATLVGYLGAKNIVWAYQAGIKKMPCVSVLFVTSNTDAYSAFHESIIQVDSWAKTQEQADQLSDRIYVVLHDQPFVVTGYQTFTLLHQTSADDFDETENVYRVMDQYLIISRVSA